MTQVDQADPRAGAAADRSPPAGTITPTTAENVPLDRSSLMNRLVWLSIVVACVPVVAAVVRAISSDWVPIDDSGYFVIRARDVLTLDHPLIGAWTSGSAAVDESVNNPGPLQFDLLAPFAKISAGAGTAIGVGLTNVASILGIGLTLKRLATPLVTIAGMVVTVGVAWSLGSALLVDTRQHQYLILPFLCFLVLCWAIACGGTWAVPWAVFAGSLVVQTHLSYLFLVAAASLFAAASCVLAVRRMRTSARSAIDDGAETSGAVRRHLVVATAILAVCWIQPLIDQFTGRGNLGSLLGASSDGKAPGYRTAAEVMSTVTTSPPLWLRPSYKEFVPYFDRPSTSYAVVTLIVLALLLTVLGALALRRRDVLAATGIALAGVAIVAGLVTAASLPPGSFGLTASNYRWLWPVSAFTLLGIITAVIRTSGLERRGQATWAAVGLCGVAALAIASFPYSYQLDDADFRGPAGIDRTRELLGQLDELGGMNVAEPVLISRAALDFGAPYAYPVMYKLQELGISFRFRDETDVRRFGEHRRDEGESATLLTIGSPGLVTPPDGGIVVAHVDGLSSDERANLDALSADMLQFARDGAFEFDLAAGRSSGREEGSDRVQRFLDGEPVDETELLADILWFKRYGHVRSESGDANLTLYYWLALSSKDQRTSVTVWISPP
jgi:hypothetical protein